jgi:hypothetical protein
LLLQPLGKSRLTVGRGKIEAFAVIGPEIAVDGVAQCASLIQYTLEYRSEIAGRGIDGLEDFGRRGLLFQGFPGLGDQPRVLQRDNGLVGKGADEFDLPVGEGLHPLSREIDRADHNPLAQKRHAEHGPRFPERHCLGYSVFGVGCDVGDVDDPTLNCRPPGHAPSARRQ